MKLIRLIFFSILPVSILNTCNLSYAMNANDEYLTEDLFSENIASAYDNDIKFYNEVILEDGKKIDNMCSLATVNHLLSTLNPIEVGSTDMPILGTFIIELYSQYTLKQTKNVYRPDIFFQMIFENNGQKRDEKISVVLRQNYTLNKILTESELSVDDMLEVCFDENLQEQLELVKLSPKLDERIGSTLKDFFDNNKKLQEHLNKSSSIVGDDVLKNVSKKKDKWQKFWTKLDLAKSDILSEVYFKGLESFFNENDNFKKFLTEPNLSVSERLEYFFNVLAKNEDKDIKSKYPIVPISYVSFNSQALEKVDINNHKELLEKIIQDDLKNNKNIWIDRNRIQSIFLDIADFKSIKKLYNTLCCGNNTITIGNNTFELAGAALLTINKDGNKKKNGSHYLAAKRRSNGKWNLIDSFDENGNLMYQESSVSSYDDLDAIITRESNVSTKNYMLMPTMLVFRKQFTPDLDPNIDNKTLNIDNKTLNTDVVKKINEINGKLFKLLRQWNVVQFLDRYYNILQEPDEESRKRLLNELSKDNYNVLLTYPDYCIINDITDDQREVSESLKKLCNSADAPKCNDQYLMASFCEILETIFSQTYKTEEKMTNNDAIKIYLEKLQERLKNNYVKLLNQKQWYKDQNTISNSNENENNIINNINNDIINQNTINSNIEINENKSKLTDDSYKTNNNLKIEDNINNIKALNNNKIENLQNKISDNSINNKQEMNNNIKKTKDELNNEILICKQNITKYENQIAEDYCNMIKKMYYSDTVKEKFPQNYNKFQKAIAIYKEQSACSKKTHEEFLKSQIQSFFQTMYDNKEYKQHIFNGNLFRINEQLYKAYHTDQMYFIPYPGKRLLDPQTKCFDKKEGYNETDIKPVKLLFEEKDKLIELQGQLESISK